MEKNLRAICPNPECTSKGIPVTFWPRLSEGKLMWLLFNNGGQIPDDINWYCEGCLEEVKGKDLNESYEGC